VPLLECYESLLNDGLLHIQGRPVETWVAVRKVEEYRLFFSPPQPQVILLAESHRFNGEQELGHVVTDEHLPETLLNQPYPREFVQFVYCLGCGENSLLDEPLPAATNTGTPQFWKLFYSCVEFPNGQPEFFWPLLKSRTPLDLRIATKTQTLFMMKQQGIWLIDASIVAINGLRRQNPQLYASILERCWDLHIGPTINEIGPPELIVIGMGVNHTLHARLEADFHGHLTVIHQPQSRNRTPEERLSDLRLVYSLCHPFII
jgi:hypothetical protein